MADIITATGLVKRYGGKGKVVTALDGLDLRVEEGTVLGLLGPNGAGKTTTVRILTTLLAPDEGSATVAGVDVIADPQAARAKIGLSGQYAAVDEHLTGAENLTMVGRLYHLGKATSVARAAELLERFGLADAADRPAKTYSGGMRRRLDLAAALVAAPPVLVLDEPTTGLDPHSRLQMWEVIRELVSSGATLLLTTQYLEEADRLADQIMVIDRGVAIAEGTADELKSTAGGERIEVVLADSADASVVAEILARVGSGEVRRSNDRELSVAVPNGSSCLLTALSEMESRSIGLLDVGLRRPTLDDVFLGLTGHHAANDEADSSREVVA
ncbi:MAG: ATP-binding cassette domain-containing protein [Nocardioides sp.]